jgi:hypothetical protein
MAQKKNVPKRAASRKNRYASYTASGIMRKNKLRRIARHMKRQPNDTVAAAAYKRADEALKVTKFKTVKENA